ncbi:MAG: ATP-binding cassette domain-containing protein, partial [Acholeplasmatales bacterium]|nr:ATP-binding cassette domain-containing protein [Acholeplasmatales bacterium]
KSKSLNPLFSIKKKKDIYYSLYVICYDMLVLILPIIILFIGFAFAANNIITVGAVLGIYSIIGAVQDPLRNVADSISYYKEIKVKKNKLAFVDENNVDNIDLIINKIKIFGKGPHDKLYDLEFEKGKFYLIKGESGIGKSSIFNKIFKDKSFSSLNCKINNVDNMLLSDQTILSQISYLKQTSNLLMDSFYNNICLYNNYSNAEFEHVINLCGLTDFIRAHKNDIYKMNGIENVSGGEKTRICLARLLMQKKPFLLIDELSSSLDNDTSINIAKNIYNYCIENGMTLVVISHKEEFDNLIENKINL